MATMNVGSSEVANQDDIAREMASAIADDSSTKTNSNLNQGKLEQSTNIVSSESGSFVRISTAEGSEVGGLQTAKTGAVALSFGEGEGPVIQDDDSQVSSQGVWGWISSAVGSDLVETTQRLGRNLVKKTKVIYKDCAVLQTAEYGNCAPKIFFRVKNSAPCKKIAKNFRAPAAPSRLRLVFWKTSETLHFHFLCS